MKLDETTIALIEEATRTAHSLGIDDIIFDKGRVRCMSEERTVVIIQDLVDFEMPFESLGITRIGLFLSRLNIVKDQADYSISIKSDDADVVQSMTMSCKGTKIEFRCSGAGTINAPKSVSDPSECIITLDRSVDSIISKAQSAMGATNITIINNKDGITFKMIDVNSDTFTHNVPCQYSVDNDIDYHFSNNYPIKLVLQLFKGVENPKFAVGQKGILRAKLNGITTFILPQVG